MRAIFQSAAGLFIGASSRKRELGVAMIAVLTILFQVNYLTPDQYESLMGLAILWTGWAQNARIKKVQKAFIDAKK